MDVNQIAQASGLVENVLETVVPVLAPFHPLIALVTTAVIAHFHATGQFPSEEQIRAAIPVDYMNLVNGWSAWRPSGDGTLKG